MLNSLVISVITLMEKHGRSRACMRALAYLAQVLPKSFWSQELDHGHEHFCTYAFPFMRSIVSFLSQELDHGHEHFYTLAFPFMRSIVSLAALVFSCVCKCHEPYESFDTHVHKNVPTPPCQVELHQSKECVEALRQENQALAHQLADQHAQVCT